jgi:hypothetical protein
MIAVGATYSIDCSIHDPHLVSTLSQKDMTGKKKGQNLKTWSSAATVRCSIVSTIMRAERHTHTHRQTDTNIDRISDSNKYVLGDYGTRIHFLISCKDVADIT